MTFLSLYFLTFHFSFYGIEDNYDEFTVTNISVVFTKEHKKTLTDMYTLVMEIQIKTNIKVRKENYLYLF